MKKKILLFLIFISITICGQSKDFVLKSPDAKIHVKVSLDETISYSVMHENDVILEKSTLSMMLKDKGILGHNPRVTKTSTNKINKLISAPIYKRAEIVDNYNELTLSFKGSFGLVFRAYDDGVAYRFVSTLAAPFIVEGEQVEYNFPSNTKAYVAYVRDNETKRGTTSRKESNDPFEAQFYNSFENVYKHINLSEWTEGKLALSPLLVEGGKGKKICVLEADLFNYPGMYLYQGDAANSLKGVFAPLPKETQQGGHNMLQAEVLERESYIASFKGDSKTVEFPWRAMVISTDDAYLADNDMVYKLAKASELESTEWIKPGKVAWDWWNAWNIYDVDFKSGINNETYKYYIDFASKFGIEYVILDEGWAVNLQADLYQVVPEIDLEDIVNYANNKDVGIILWAGYYALNKDIEGICKHYAQMGVKGFKIDFMDRDDQQMVNFHSRVSSIAAQYKLLVDFHGSYKPTGLQRTFPNVINFEGVFGLEQMKWSNETVDQVTYDVTMPFIRMVAGPVDYTQGAMRNAAKGNYRPINTEAMSQGTRCRQLAQYVVFESPLNMLCDNPSNYMKDVECTNFIATIPTVWDETRVLAGKVGEYIVTARRKGDIWYVGGMTNWDEREIEVDLSFLDSENYKVEQFKDGINADRVGRDFRKDVLKLPDNKKLNIHMAPGGGFALKIYL